MNSTLTAQGGNKKEENIAKGLVGCDYLREAIIFSNKGGEGGLFE